MSSSFMKAVKASNSHNTEILDFDGSDLKLEGVYELIAVTDIYSEEQHRVVFEEEPIIALMHSMIAEGQIQPIVVSPLDSKGYCIQEGERRWRAAKMSGGKITHMECIIKKKGTMTQQFSENFFREDFTPFEIGNAFDKIKSEKGWGNKELANHFKLSEPVVSSYLKCITAQDFIKDAYTEGKISDVDTINVLRVAGKSDPEKTKALLERHDKVTRKQAQDFNKSLKDKKPAVKKSKPPTRKASQLKGESSTTINRICVTVDGDHGVIDATATAEKGHVVVKLDNTSGELTVPVSDVVLVGYAQP